MPQKRLEKLQVMLSDAELEAIDDFWFENHLPSRSDAVRELIRRGLHTPGVIDAGNAIRRRGSSMVDEAGK